MNVLVVDVGGTHVKLLATGQSEPRKFVSGPTLTAERMVADDPRHLTLEWHRDERGARIYIDVNRVAYAQHAVAPYAVRPRPGAPVAMPIAWEELSDRALAPDRWTIATAADRLDAEGDAWAGIGRHARRLPPIID